VRARFTLAGGAAVDAEPFAFTVHRRVSVPDDQVFALWFERAFASGSEARTAADRSYRHRTGSATARRACRCAAPGH
jgi:hypothetical protein